MHFLQRGAVATAAAILIAGCSLQPVYQQPVAPVAAAYPQGEGHGAVGNAGADLPPAFDIGWRDFLQDERLQRLIDM